MRWVSLAVLLLGAIALALNAFLPISPEVLDAQPLPALDPDARMIEGDGFSEGGGYITDSGRLFGPGLHLFGSWMGSDASTGEVHTRRYRADGTFYVGVSGYPNGKTLRLEADLDCKGGHRRVTIPPRPTHGEIWGADPVVVDGALGPCEVSLVGVDGSKDREGWVGFSEPFMPQARLGSQLLAWLRLLSCLGLVLTVVLGPGLALRHRMPERLRELSFGLLALPGIAASVSIAVLMWSLAPRLPARTVGEAALALVVVLVAWQLTTHSDRALGISADERRVLAAVLAVVGIATAKATWSRGPAGELFWPTIARTLEVGDRSDPQIPYFIVQLITRGEPRHGGYAQLIHWPYNFSSRGPLAGLAAAPVALATATRHPNGLPEEPWEPFDAEGYAAYRLVLIVLGATVLLAAFALARQLAGAVAGRWAAALLATTPFVVHEVYFTWPKLLATQSVLWSVLLLDVAASVGSGVALAVAYLFHPLALFSTPFVGLWALAKQVGLRGKIKRGAALFVGWAVVVGVWWLINRGHFDQGMFVRYVVQTNNSASETWQAWVGGRMTSLANTLVPTYLFFARSADPWVNAYRSESPPVIHFFFQYWNTLPFALGLLGLPLLGRWMVQGAVQRPAAFVVLIVLPFVLFWLYWGSFWSGLMREGLHVWLFAIVLFCVCSRFDASSEGPLTPAGRWAFSIARALEVLAMVALPILMTSPLVIDRRFFWSDVAALVLLGGATVALALTCGSLLQGAVDPERKTG